MNLDEITEDLTVEDGDTITNEDTGLVNPDLPGSGQDIPIESGDENEDMNMKKKAVNVQDLVFVRQYIDKKINTEVTDMINNNVKEKVENDVPIEVEKQMGENYYTKTETEGIFYKRTDTVSDATHAAKADEAGHASSADDSSKVNGLEIVKGEDGILRFGNIIIPQRQILWKGNQYVTAPTTADTWNRITITLNESIKVDDWIEIIYNHDAFPEHNLIRAKRFRVFGFDSSVRDGAHKIQFTTYQTHGAFLRRYITEVVTASENEIIVQSGWWYDNNNNSGKVDTKYYEIAKIIE